MESNSNLNSNNIEQMFPILFSNLTSNGFTFVGITSGKHAYQFKNAVGVKVNIYLSGKEVSFKVWSKNFDGAGFTLSAVACRKSANIVGNAFKFWVR